MLNPNFVVSAIAVVVAIAFWFIWRNRAAQ